MPKQYRYPTELLHDAYWKGNPAPYTVKGQRRRFPIKNTGSEPCAICGRTDFTIGFNTYETTPHTSHMGSVISSNFGDQFLLAQPYSAITCPFCESVTRAEFKSLNGLVANPDNVWMIVGAGKGDLSHAQTKRGRPQFFNLSDGTEGFNSIVATQTSAGKSFLTQHMTEKILTGDFHRLMLEPPDPPFIFAFNRAGVGKNGTHFAYLAPINYDRDSYVISFYNNQIRVDRHFLLEIWERIVHKDPLSNTMSTGAILSGERASMRAALRQARENEKENKPKGKRKPHKNMARKILKTQAQMLFEQSAFATDPDLLARTLLHDNFRALELFFMSIASYRKNHKAPATK